MISARYSAMVASGFCLWYSKTCPIKASRLSTRASSCGSRLSSNAARYPERFNAADNTSAILDSTAIASRSFSSLEKAVSEFVSFGPRPRVSVRPSPCRKEISSRLASSAILSSVFSPIPLEGSFKILRIASSSRGFAIAVR